MILDDTFSPTATAPKTGVYIVVGHEDVGTFLRRWQDDATNEFFAPGETGMWVEYGGGMTWKTFDGEGPSHWKPADETTLN